MKDTGPFDCILIPGAEKAADAAMVVDCVAGGMGGIVSASGTISITVCSKLMLVTSEGQQAFPCPVFPPVHPVSTQNPIPAFAIPPNFLMGTFMLCPCHYFMYLSNSQQQSYL